MSDPSGLCQTWTVHLRDGSSHKAMVEVADATAWERTFKRGWFDSDRPSLAQLSWRCWHALKRQGDYAEGWPTFDGSVVDLELTDANTLGGPEDSVVDDPTQSAPMDDS